MTSIPRLPALPHPFRTLPRRSDRPEILDTNGKVSDLHLIQSLNQMSKVNRYLGGVQSLLRHLRPIARSHAELSLLDLGVGIGDVPRALARSLSVDGVRVRWTGVDLDERVLHLARRPSTFPPTERGALVRGDACRLPFEASSFDVVISTLTLHHLSEDDARRFLTEAARVARLAVLVSDLERHPLHYLGARLLAATWWRRDPVTRYDGPLSVLRSYRRGELADLCAGLPFRRIRLTRHLPFRIVLHGTPA